MLGLFKRVPPPKLVQMWEPLCMSAKECFSYVCAEITKAEHGDVLLGDIDRVRLFVIICNGALTGLFLKLTSGPAEGRRYIDSFSDYFAKFVETHMPDLNGEKYIVATEFADANKNVLPTIIARSGIWRNNPGGRFVFEQAITAYVIRDSAREKYLEQLPNLGSYMPPLPVSMFKIWSEMVAYGNNLEASAN